MGGTSGGGSSGGAGAIILYETPDVVFSVKGVVLDVVSHLFLYGTGRLVSGCAGGDAVHIDRCVYDMCLDFHVVVAC